MAINSNKVDRILEQLNESMMRAGEAAANAKPADITVLTQIVDDVHKLDGYYYVYDGSVKFKAYSDNVNYKVGQRVYVLIPQGDYSQQKLIQGRYFQPFDSVEFADEDFNDYYPLTPIKLSKTELTLEPTKEKTVYPLCTINGNPEINDKQYLALSFKLASNFGQNVLRNSYVFGLEVNLKFSSSETTSSETISDDVTYSLSSRDILGDPYNYLSWHLCRALIELPHYENENYRITQVNIAVKEQGPLTTLDGSALPESASFNLKDIEVSFGNKVNKIGDTIIISTLQGTDYDSAQIKESNQKDIYLSWMHSYVDTDDENKLNVIEFNNDNNPKVKGSTLSYEDDFDISDVIISWYQDIEYNANQYMENLQGEINFAENTLFDIVKRWSEANGLDMGLSEDDSDVWWKINPPFDENNPKRNVWGSNVALDSSEKWNIFTELVDNFRLTDANYSIINTTGQDGTVESSVKFYSSAIRKIKDALSSIDKNKIKLEQAQKTENEDHSENTDGTRIRGETDYLLTYDPDETRQNCAVWVEMEIIYPDKSSKKLKSNKLEFKNAQQIPNQATVLAAAEVAINLADGSNGVYNLYDPNTNRLYSDLENKKRLMFVTCTDKDDNSIFMGQEIIIWQFPKKNTMLQLMDEDYLNYDETEDKENIYFCTKEVQGDLNSIKELFNNGNVKIDLDNYIYYGYKKPGSSRYISYKLNPYLNRDALNNEVKCYIIKNNTVLTGAITPLFRQHIVPSSRYRLEMSIGEKYDINFKKVDSESYSIIHGDNDWHKLDIKIFDNITNEEKDLTLSQFSDIINLWSRNEGFYSGFLNENWFNENIDKSHCCIRSIGSDINTAKFRVLKGILPKFDNDDSNSYIGYLPVPIKVLREQPNSNIIAYGGDIDIYEPAYETQLNELGEIERNSNLSREEKERKKKEKVLEIVDQLENDIYTYTGVSREIKYITAGELLNAFEINGHGIIGYDKDNANPTYFKEKLKVVCNNFSDELNKLEIELAEAKKTYENWLSKVKAFPERWWTPLMFTSYGEFIKIDSEWRMLKAKIDAIQTTLENKGNEWVYSFSLDYENEANKKWGPELSDYDYLRPKSQYIDHFFDDNGMPTDNHGITIKATIKRNGVEFADLYKPVVVIQNMDSTEMVVQEFKGGIITLEKRVTEKSTSGDGSQVQIVNKTETKIESTNLGSLRVNDSGQYSGIVMGNIVTQYPWEANGSNLISALAGYRNNVQTFELNNNGNLYLGTPPKTKTVNNKTVGTGGGLRFDGDKAIIEGGYIYDETSNTLKPGMTIDFNTGSIETQKSMSIKAGGSLDFEYGTGGQFCVKNKSDTEHIKLTDNGLDIKAKNIILNGNGDFVLTAGNSSEIKFTDKETSKDTLVLNNSGLVMTQGNISLGGGTFTVTDSGVLNAKSGIIAGWNIMPGYFTSQGKSGSLSGTKYEAGMAPYSTVYFPGSASDGNGDGIKSYAFWAGELNRSDDGIIDSHSNKPAFYVTYEGKVYSNGVELGPALGQVDSNLTSENISKWDEAFEKRHIHDNLTVLNNLTQSVITNSHTHNNKTVLDGIDDTVLVNKKKIKTILAKINELVTEFNNLTGLSMGTLPDNWNDLPETN